MKLVIESVFPILIVTLFILGILGFGNFVYSELKQSGWFESKAQLRARLDEILKQLHTARLQIRQSDDEKCEWRLKYHQSVEKHESK